MIYIYDVVLNWSEKDYSYEFFEWEYSDDIEYVKKIPIIKVQSIKHLLNNKFKLDDKLLDKIKNLTEVYTRNKTKKLEYALILSDGTYCLAVELEKDGTSLFKSKLQLIEEREVLELIKNIETTNLNYELLTKNSENYLTRKEEKIKKYLTNEILRCYKDKKQDKLEYLYLEYFGKCEENLDKITKNLIDSLQDIDDRHIELFELLNYSYHYTKIK